MCGIYDGDGAQGVTGDGCVLGEEIPCIDGVGLGAYEADGESMFGETMFDERMLDVSIPGEGRA